MMIPPRLSAGIRAETSRLCPVALLQLHSALRAILAVSRHSPGCLVSTDIIPLAERLDRFLRNTDHVRDCRIPFAFLPHLNNHFFLFSRHRKTPPSRRRDLEAVLMKIYIIVLLKNSPLTYKPRQNQNRTVKIEKRNPADSGLSCQPSKEYRKIVLVFR